MAESEAFLQHPTLECIASRHRRKSLLALEKWGPEMATRQVASYLAATDHGTASPSPSEIETVHTQLTHVHLPALEAVDLVSWDQERETVQKTTHPALADPRFEQLLKFKADNLDTVLSALSHEYRRIGLTVLETEQRTSRTELADEIRQCLPETVRHDSPSVEEISLSLHHAHLPKLNESDLIEFDPTTGHVSSADHPVLEQVFTIIFERDDSTTEKLDGFLGGLTDSYQEARRGTNSRAEWPHFWNDPYYG